MEELTIADVVLILKPLCDSFINQPTDEKVTKIAMLVNRTSDTIIQKICENILYPMTFHIKNNTFSKDENFKLIQIIRVIISKIKIEKLKLFYEIYHCLRMQICQKNNTMELIEAHEELKETVILCLNDLISNCSINIIKSFYTRQHAALLSHGIYLCVKTARVEKSISLRLSAIKTIMTLLQVHDESELQDKVLSNQIADVIMLYLPGIASGLLEIALGTDIQNHKITVMAIRVWSRGITLVMRDMPQNQDQDITSLSINLKNIKFKDSNNIETIKHILETKKTSDWYFAVSQKFKIIFTELDILTKHSHFKVRKELVEAVSFLLLNCSRNMKPCFQVLFEILITLLEDENSEVSKEANRAFYEIKNKFVQDNSMKSIIEMVEENLYDLLIKMPRIIRTSDKSVQIIWLNRLAGYLKILGKQSLSRILFSTAHLQKLILSLVCMAELDVSNISILEDVATINFEKTTYIVSHSWKQYKFLFDPICVKKLNNIFKILGEYGDKNTLIDSILKMTFEVPKFKKELILILNKLLEVSVDSTIQMLIFKQVIEHYTESNTWNLPTMISEEITLQIAQNNIIQCCLLIEGLGIIAKVLQEKYQDFLLKTLYIVIERAGSKHRLLRYLGLSTLEIIRKSQKLDTIEDLFRDNCDYITYHVTVKLRRVERNPGVLNVVEVVTKYSTLDFLPELKEIVYDLLLQANSNVQKHNTQSFLKVFFAFMICVKTLTSNNVSQQNEKYVNKSKDLKPSEIIINNISEYYNANKNSKLFESDENLEYESNKNLINNVTNDTNIENHSNLDLDENEKDVEVPYFIIMIQDIMKHCLHFLPSQNFNESSLAISILKEGVFILKNAENVLLPIIHELWHPLVHRFQSSNLLIINEAFQLIYCLSEVSKNFIRSRTLKQILPTLSNFLKNSAKESYKKDSRCTYKYSQIYKLQKEILSKLSSIVKNLKLLEKDLWNILSTAECYLDCHQNSQLQEYCVNMFKDISEYNTDIVWIKCIDIWNRHVEIVEIEDNFDKWYTKVTNYHEKSHYQRNILQILTYIQTKYKML